VVVVVVVVVVGVVVVGFLLPWPPHPASAQAAIAMHAAIPARRAAKRADTMHSVLSVR
jgi:hypothetical protein